MKELKIYQTIFGRDWNPFFALFVAGILAAIYFGITGTLWAVTGEFTRWGGNILQICGIDPQNWAYFKAIKLPPGGPLNRTDGVMVIGMLIGALFSSLMSKGFKFRGPRLKRQWIMGIVGGLLSGFGTRLAMGCNLAALFTGIPQFSLHAWYFTVGTIIGSYFAVKLVKLRIFRGDPAPESNESNAYKGTMKQIFIGSVTAGVGTLFAVYEFVVGHDMLGIAIVFGFAFGFLIARGKISFTAGLADLWIKGQGKMAKAIIIGMGIQSVLTAIFIAHGSKAIIHWASPGALIGGILFGLGIVIAGGCETGWMFRLMEGRVQYLAVAVGNIVGATVLAYAWDHCGIFNLLVNGYPNFDMVKSFGMTSAICVTFFAFIVMYLLVVWRENFVAKKALKGTRSGIPTTQRL